MIPLSWDSLKRAAREYALYRPRLIRSTFSLSAGQSSVALPVDVFDALFVDYGPRVSLPEVVTAAEGEQGWCINGSTLLLSPAPTEDTEVPVIWAAYHTVDDVNEAFPTIPGFDIDIVHWLAEADTLDSGAADSNLSGYSIGSLRVEWDTPAGTQNTRSVRLRQQAINRLSEPFADWG